MRCMLYVGRPTLRQGVPLPLRYWGVVSRCAEAGRKACLDHTGDAQYYGVSGRITGDEEASEAGEGHATNLPDLVVALVFAPPFYPIGPLEILPTSYYTLVDVLPN